MLLPAASVSLCAFAVEPPRSWQHSSACMKRSPRAWPFPGRYVGLLNTAIASSRESDLQGHGQPLCNRIVNRSTHQTFPLKLALIALSDVHPFFREHHSSESSFVKHIQTTLLRVKLEFDVRYLPDQAACIFRHASSLGQQVLLGAALRPHCFGGSWSLKLCICLIRCWAAM